MFIVCNFFCSVGPTGASDTALYYVLCDKGCLLTDNRSVVTVEAGVSIDVGIRLARYLTIRLEKACVG